MPGSLKENREGTKVSDSGVLMMVLYRLAACWELPISFCLNRSSGTSCMAAVVSVPYSTGFYLRAAQGANVDL